MTKEQIVNVEIRELDIALPGEEEIFVRELLAKVKRDLPGKDLVCYCSPAPCHGDILLFEANPELANPKGSLFDII